MNKKMKWTMICASGIAALATADSLQIRPKNFIVTPSTGPVAEVLIKNRSAAACTATIQPVFPEGWSIAPAQREITVNVGETAMATFAITTGLDLKANEYPVAVAVNGKTQLETTVVCATTPYFKPEIDGDLEEWREAVPVTFMTGGKKTVVYTYWNKDQFSLAVEVEEDELHGLKDGPEGKGIDAIQFALSPGKSVTPESGAAVRYEFLAAASGSRWKGDKCFQLMSPGGSIEEAASARELSPLAMEDAEVKVKHSDGVTRYEVAVPMKPMKTLRATAGREFCFSLLVHDPDGTGVRDMGSVMNLWEESRSAAAWSRWNWAAWNGYVPYDNKVEFGFCSSVH